MSNVIDIGEMRFTRKQRSYAAEKQACKHQKLTMDDEGDIVECEDCGKQLSAYWVLQMLTSHYHDAYRKLNGWQEKLTEAAAKDVGLLAAQKVERAWRSRTMVPTCPHCHEAIFPGDGFGGCTTNKEIALRRRAIKATP